jgi:hypothetical protein
MSWGNWASLILFWAADDGNGRFDSCGQTGTKKHQKDKGKKPKNSNKQGFRVMKPSFYFLVTFVFIGENDQFNF